MWISHSTVQLFVAQVQRGNDLPVICVRHLPMGYRDDPATGRSPSQLRKS